MSESTATSPARTVVVAGGSGFIGRHLTPALAAAGYQVVVLGRGRQAAGEAGRSAAGGVRFVTWQPGEDGAWQQQLAGARAVVNLCGAGIGDGRWTESRKRLLLDSRTVPSRALVAACNALEHPPAVLLQASGVGYYGTGDAAVDEGSPPGEDFLARLAVAWEAPLDDAALAAAGVSTVRLRFGVVLGRDGGALPQMLLPFRLFAGGPVASGRQWLSWVHVDDLVNALMHLIGTTDAPAAAPLPAACNICSPHPVQNREFADSAARALHRPAWLRLPRVALQTALGEQATLVCDGQRALPRALQATGFEFRYPRIDQALQQLLP